MCSTVTWRIIMTISNVDVSHLLGELKCIKSGRLGDLRAEYFKFSYHKLNVLLSLCFLLYFLHLPLSMIVIFNKCIQTLEKTIKVSIAFYNYVFQHFPVTFQITVYDCEMLKFADIF